MKPSRPINEQSSTATAGLYLHIPFCQTKCGYCDFFSVAGVRDTGPLVERMICELENRMAQCSYDIRTVFCGGGTPTLLPVDQLRALLRAIGQYVTVGALSEFTVEANPATVDDEKAEALIEMGVNRVSLGAQSFIPAELATLERIHNPDDIPRSVALLRNHGMEQINVDLIFGIPGQSIETWADSLRRALELNLDHIACYNLTYEPGTRLTAMRDRGRITRSPEPLEVDLYEYTIETLAAAGFEHYEISNFARPGCRSQHNINYWRNGPYVSVGPSAAGLIGNRRYKNIADVAGYIRMIDEVGHAEAEVETVEGETLAHELIMMQLRLIEGLSITDFHQRTGADPIVLFDGVLDQLVAEGLVAVGNTHIAMTHKGRLVGDWVIGELACACNLDLATVPTTAETPVPLP